MDNSSWWAYYFDISGVDRELLLVALESLPFSGFEENDQQLIAYVSFQNATEAFSKSLTTLTSNPAVSWSRVLIPDQNWNEQWESSFKAVQVGNFVGVRAEFHPPFEGVEHQLLIHPRMAFGTGHHATTFLVMERMGELDFGDKAVFDFGCGTGILAILAKRLHAGSIDAVDIEAAATENTIVNMEANEVEGIQVFTGELDAVPVTTYDIILANINRNVILNSLAALYERTKPGGDLLVSGILEKDQDMVNEKAESCGWSLCLKREREGWMLLHYRRA